MTPAQILLLVISSEILMPYKSGDECLQKSIDSIVRDPENWQALKNVRVDSLDPDKIEKVTRRRLKTITNWQFRQATKQAATDLVNYIVEYPESMLIRITIKCRSRWYYVYVGHDYATMDIICLMIGGLSGGLSVPD